MVLSTTSLRKIPVQEDDVTATSTLLFNKLVKDRYVYVHMYFIPTYIRQRYYVFERICPTKTKPIFVCKFFSFWFTYSVTFYTKSNHV